MGPKAKWLIYSCKEHMLWRNYCVLLSLNTVQIYRIKKKKNLKLHLGIKTSPRGTEKASRGNCQSVIFAEVLEGLELRGKKTFLPSQN